MIKIDMNIVYDKLEYELIFQVTMILGLFERFCNLIKQCILSISYTILLNGSKYGYIKPSRGLRQEDPLFSYLFIVTIEILSRMLGKTKFEQNIHGIRILRNSLPIFHLFYVDDILLFCRAKENEVDHLLQILNEYGVMSGKIQNLTISGIFLSKNASRDLKRNLSSRA